MPMYANIDGAQKEQIEFYTNINGAQKELLSLYANINNAQKNIFQKTYTWAMYKSQRSSTTRYDQPVQEDVYRTFTLDDLAVEISPAPGTPTNDRMGFYYGTSYNYNNNYGTFTLSGVGQVDRMLIGDDWYYPSWAECHQAVGNYILIDGLPNHVAQWGDTPSSFSSVTTRLRIDYQMHRGAVKYRWDYVFQKYVTSTNPNAYQTSSTASYYDSASSGSKTAYVFIK